MIMPFGTITEEDADVIRESTQCVAKIATFNESCGRELKIWGPPQKLSECYEKTFVKVHEHGDTGGRKSDKEQQKVNEEFVKTNPKGCHKKNSIFTYKTTPRSSADDAPSPMTTPRSSVDDAPRLYCVSGWRAPLPCPVGGSPMPAKTQTPTPMEANPQYAVYALNTIPDGGEPPTGHGSGAPTCISIAYSSL